MKDRVIYIQSCPSLMTKRIQVIDDFSTNYQSTLFALVMSDVKGVQAQLVDTLSAIYNPERIIENGTFNPSKPFHNPYRYEVKSC